MNRLLIVALIFIAACSSNETREKFVKIDHPNSHVDVHSFAQPDSAVIRHLSLSINVDFDSSVIRGVAAYNIDTYGAKHIHFDISDMDIVRVYIDNPDKLDKLKSVKFQINVGNDYGDDLVDRKSVV